MENVFHEVYVVPLSAVPGIQDWTEKGTEQPEENADISVYRKHLSGAGDSGDRCDYDEQL